MKDFLSKLLPASKLTLTLHHPQTRTIAFFKKLNGDIWLDADKSHIYHLKSFDFQGQGTRKVSDGAKAGAMVAATRGGNVLRGAIIGDWWEKERDKTARKVTFVLIDKKTGQEKDFQLHLSMKNIQELARFFGVYK